MFFGPEIFAFVLGEKWWFAGEYACWIALWTGVVFISSPLSNLVNVLEKQRFHLLFNIALFIARLATLVIGGVVFQDALVTIKLYSITGAAFAAFLLAWLLAISKRT